MSGAFERWVFCGECGKGVGPEPPPGYRYDVCPDCGARRWLAEVVRRERVGRWPWQRGWVTKNGERRGKGHPPPPPRPRGGRVSPPPIPPPPHRPGSRR